MLIVFLHIKTTGSSVQGCSAWEWVKCAGEVAQCAADCSKGITTQSCISCLGDSYNDCKGCFSLVLEIKKIKVAKSNFDLPHTCNHINSPL